MFAQIHYVNVEIMLEVLFAEHLFCFTLEKHKGYLFRLFFSTLACMAASFFIPIIGYSPALIIANGLAAYLIIFALSGIALRTCYKENLWVILFCCVTGYTIQNLSSAFRTLLEDAFQYYALTVSEVAVYLFSYLAVYLVCFFVFSKVIRKNPQIVLNNRQMLLLSCTAIFVDIFLGLILFAIDTQQTRIDYSILIQTYQCLCGIFILCIQFGLLINKSLEAELVFMGHLLDESKRQYQMSKDNIQLINLKCHDLKHQIRHLRTGQSDISRESLKEIEDAVGLYDAVARTGNDALDVILTEKNMVCEKADIQLTCMCEGGQMDFLTASDTYSLFGNALDNAIEAVTALDDHAKRSISINVRQNGKLLIIHVENYFSGSLTFSDDLPVTNKTDKKYHGFGMKSMRMIAEKYNGYLTATAEGDIFHLNILIPIK